MPNPAYRIETDRLVLRCWKLEDAPLLKDAIDASLESLREWMPWAHDEPSTIGELTQRLREFRSAFDADDDYIYGILDPDESTVLGGSGLHRRVGANGLEIGYWIRSERQGEGLATEVAAALTRVGLEHEGVDRIQIHCGPGNRASARIAEKLGFTHEATLRRRREEHDGSMRDTEIHTLFADEFSESTARDYDIRAFDAAGRQLELGERE